jgi:hypothetical protein
MPLLQGKDERAMYMADRNEKGQFVKGHKPIGKPFEIGGKAVESGHKGGIASGVSKRQRKIWREEMDDILLQEVTSAKGNTATKNRVILEQQVNKAMKGDTKAAIFVGTITGDYRTNMEVNMSNVPPIVLEPIPEE